jgi:DNA-directed RNA polymerase subunit RPC12/RpoP
MIFCCAACGARLEIMDEAAQRGAKVRCPRCSVALMIHKDLAPEAPLFDSACQAPACTSPSATASDSASANDDLFAGIDPGLSSASINSNGVTKNTSENLFSDLGLDDQVNGGLHGLGNIDVNAPGFSLEGKEFNKANNAVCQEAFSSPFDEFELTLPQGKPALGSRKAVRSESLCATCVWAVRRYGPRAGSIVGAVALGALAAGIIAWTINNYLDRREAKKAELLVEDVIDGFYETRDGRFVFLVSGTVVNRSLESKQAVNVVVELIRGSKVSRVAQGVAGSAPTPEELYAITSAADNQDLQQKLAVKGHIIDPADSAIFGVVFYEYPDDIAEHSVRVRVGGGPN